MSDNKATTGEKQFASTVELGEFTKRELANHADVSYNSSKNWVNYGLEKGIIEMNGKTSTGAKVFKFVGK